MMGCSSQPDDPSLDALTVSGRVITPAGARTTIRVVLPGRNHVITDDMYAADPGSGYQYARIAQIPGSGEMHTIVAVTASSTDTIAYVDLAFPLARGHAYGIDVSRHRGGDPSFPMGPGVLRKFPLRGSAAGSTDSLWVYVVNSVPCKGCVY